MFHFYIKVQELKQLAYGIIVHTNPEITMGDHTFWLLSYDRIAGLGRTKTYEPKPELRMGVEVERS